ncbi:DUF4307 domain-containing protein [Brevibacterium litoralis]|uniref:DUF4307 domain-containing protein n=1 Tax=Brevibacterium litoralis TaxID=3138935 RepID=UPI0032EAD547
MSTTVHRPAERYGTRAPRVTGPRRRRRTTVLVTAALSLGVLAAAAFAFRPATTPVDPTTQKYESIDHAHTEVTFSVVEDAEKDIVCAVQATNEQYAVVGYTEVTVPADPQAAAHEPAITTVTVRTTQLAASGHVESCRFVD